MQISLCLLVKDEERTLESCLTPIHDLFDDIVVMDTGSTGRTCEVLRDRFGLDPLHGVLEERLCFAKFEARNRVIAQAKHPWILFLDADERITRAQAAALLGMADDPATSGYFCAWNTFIDGAVIEDYKLSLFRRDVRYSGLIHENPQQHVRRQGQHAGWLDALSILHHPEPAKLEEKRRLYRWRLRCALARDDAWYRYHWFMGYMLYRAGETQDAIHQLSRAAAACDPQFAVECLNSHMVLASMHAERGDAHAAADILNSALGFYGTVSNDFEVKINFRLKPWLDSALAACSDGRPCEARAYDFAC